MKTIVDALKVIPITEFVVKTKLKQLNFNDIFKKLYDIDIIKENNRNYRENAGIFCNAIINDENVTIKFDKDKIVAIKEVIHIGEKEGFIEITSDEALSAIQKTFNTVNPLLSRNYKYIINLGFVIKKDNKITDIITNILHKHASKIIIPDNLDGGQRGYKTVVAAFNPNKPRRGVPNKIASFTDFMKCLREINDINI